MKYCSKCGFILGTRPGLIDINGVCLACENSENKKNVPFASRQEWLTKFIKQKQTNSQYDCLIAVSGGKDSHMIVRRLIDNHGIKNPLLVSVTDEFTHTKAGQYNIDNIVKRYDLDHITFRCKPMTFRKETLKDFETELHPLKWIEEKIYSVPVDIAKKFGISLVFYGENSAYEYGTSDSLEIFHPASTSDLSIIFMGAIYPYSISDSLAQARAIGFKDLDDFNEWPREGSIDQFTQIDSIAYIIQLWTKYPKFGFQRVSDIASRYVREGLFTLSQAREAIDANDAICDPAAKKDFCDCIGITEEHFDEVCDKFYNQGIFDKTATGWKLK